MPSISRECLGILVFILLMFKQNLYMDYENLLTKIGDGLPVEHTHLLYFFSTFKDS